MKNYKQTASDVLRLVGGEKNVVQVEHCSTRLRFTLADTSKVDAAALKKTAGVMGVISSGPHLPAAGSRHCGCRRSEGSDGAAEHSGPDEQRRYRL